MSYEWQNEFVEGNVRMVCGICGVPYRFPDEMTVCDDRVIRCNRTCMEETILARDRKIAASHGRRERVPPPFGSKASWDTAAVPTINCAGGVVDSAAGTINLPLAYFDDSIVNQTVTLSGTGDPDNEGAHRIIAVLSRTKLRVVSGIADQALSASMTATVP